MIKYNNGNYPASPIKLNERVEFPDGSGVTINECDDYHEGLTKREHFAVMAMQGLLSNHLVIEFADIGVTKNLSVAAVAFSDALLQELDKN